MYFYDDNHPGRHVIDLSQYTKFRLHKFQIGKEERVTDKDKTNASIDKKGRYEIRGHNPDNYREDALFRGHKPQCILFLELVLKGENIIASELRKLSKPEVLQGTDTP